MSLVYSSGKKRGERASGTRDPGGHAIYPGGDGAAVVVDVRAIEQVGTVRDT